MTPAAQGWRRDLGVALATGMAGGVLLGTREGLATFASNAFADPQHHAIAYLVVPIAVWFFLGPLLMLPVAAVARLRGPVSATTYAAALGGIGTLLALAPWLEDGLVQMRANGVAPSRVLLSALALLTSGLAIAVALFTRAAVAWHVQRSARPFRHLVRMTALAGALACVWTGRFLVSSLGPREVEAATSYAASAGKPNVLLISIDTLRADALGAYGSTSGGSPALDRLAADGVTFEQAITPAPWTLPALASLVTGLYPRHHGAGAVTNRHDPLGRSSLAPGVQTLAETLAAEGWQTQAIVTNPYLLAQSGLAAGYHGYENLTFLSEAMLTGRTNAGQWLFNHLAAHLVAGDRGSEVSDRAVRWLADVEHDRPFLLWLHYLDPHGPYGGAGESRHKTFRGENLFGALSGRGAGLEARSPEPVRMRSGEVRLNAEEKDAVRALYRAEVAEVDHQVGRVLAALDERGLRERTLVVVVSDHGEEFWEHGGVEHGHTLYDEVLRVAMLMRWPGHLPQGERVATVTSLVDVAPTIHDLFGLAEPTTTDGVSLVPLMRGKAVPERAVLSENMLFTEERVALRTDQTKLVRWANGKEEAYDLVRDPAERRDLAGVEPFVAALRDDLDDLTQAMVPTVARSAGANIPVGALRALGYVH